MATKRYLKIGALLIFKNFGTPIIIITVLILLVCYITEIFYLGIRNEESNIAEEIKYYTTAEYTKEDGDFFLKAIQDFIDGIFSPEIIADAEWPVLGSYYITSDYGYREAPTAGASTFHSGIDIAADQGTKLVAIMNGKVTYTGWQGAGGFTVTIQSDEYSFSYCHSDPNFIVKVGETVKKGQVIGKVGPKNVYGVAGNPYKDSNGNPTNGATTGCHCHFTVRKSGQIIDPMEILNRGGIL